MARSDSSSPGGWRPGRRAQPTSSKQAAVPSGWARGGQMAARWPRQQPGADRSPASRRSGQRRGAGRVSTASRPGRFAQVGTLLGRRQAPKGRGRRIGEGLAGVVSGVSAVGSRQKRSSRGRSALALLAAGGAGMAALANRDKLRQAVGRGSSDEPATTPVVEPAVIETPASPQELRSQDIPGQGPETAGGDNPVTG